MKKFIFPLLYFICLTAFNHKDYNTSLQIKNHRNNKVNNFLVNIAKTEEERQKGLMFVKNLPKSYGMLFEFENEQMIYMWMKNTRIPLDMIFINQEGKIIGIKANAKVESLEVISSILPAKKVLEINGGLAKELGIEVGDLVFYKASNL